ncbi:exosortase A [Ferribacterium limneticum]|uniref:exosortase A n=1 Tax=Ferribacterium limneticum TaxID=76259 RepID=UPI001CF8B59F|nr:exosortase A [Ferribacterium limneticum]UCV26655.1 exosortase A [Ferribacterium limneticum]UCV30572.1 exosortase A [Ferribacterium limneticum]
MPLATRLPTAWQRTLPLLLALIGWILFWYWETLSAMVGIWERSDTYAHAFIVPPIALWLIWRKRDELLALQPNASGWLAIPLAVATFLWLLGQLTAVNALTQFALVVTLILAIMSLLGLKISRHIAFPLFFLLFSVPIGDFMMPKLMDWTAAFTVTALRATGIPVYQEGNQFVIPSGNWSVVEACSGIRYIIASVTVGTLFAYLNFVSLRRRLLFILVSILVPVVANWLRAYMIVMLGHFSGNKLAVGVDHLIYGWVFFGVVMMAMFMIGARWAEEPASSHPAPWTVTSTGKSGWLASLIIALVAAAGPLAFTAIDQLDKANEPRLAPLTLSDGWQEHPPFASWHPAFDAPPAKFQAAFSKDNKFVGLYVAYYRNQDYQRKLVTSTNTLVTTNDSVWSVISRDTASTSIDGLPAVVRTAQLLGRDTTPPTNLIVWQWYWINGKLVTSDAEAKIQTALSRLRGAGDDSAVIMIYAPSDSATDTLPVFSAQAAGAINQWLTTTRDAR